MSYNFSKEEIAKALETAKSITGAARLMGVSYNAFARLAKKYNCFITNQAGKGIPRKNPRAVTREVLDLVFQNKHYITAYKLKGYLFKFELKERKCECCGLSEWLGKEIPLELHHKNGNHHDNTWDNLQILCPNCHGQTEHYRGSNKVSHKDKKAEIIELTEEEKNILYSLKEEVKKREKQIHKNYSKCLACGKDFETNNKRTKFCSVTCMTKYNSRHIPSKEDFIEVIKKCSSVIQLARYYNMSDNGIKRWIKKYDIDIAKYGYRKLKVKNNKGIFSNTN